MGMVLRNPGKVEILGVVADHADLVHDPLRAEVQRRGIGEDLIEAELAEAEIEGGPGALGRIAPAPMRPASRQPISMQGVKGTSRSLTASPMKPMKGATAGSSTAQRPKP